MTLIAACWPNGYPLALGDIIISSEVKTDQAVFLPSLGKLAPKAGTGPRIVGLRQKVCLINGDIAIAWAGSAIGAKAVISDFKQRFSAERATVDNIERSFSGVPLAPSLAKLIRSPRF